MFVCFIDLILYVPVSSYGHVGVLPLFYGTSTQVTKEREVLDSILPPSRSVVQQESLKDPRSATRAVRTVTDLIFLLLLKFLV